MTDAPERIWIDAWGGNWSPVSGGTQEIEYVRADRIEALTEQLEAARADAKEAEAYAEELEKEKREAALDALAAYGQASDAYEVQLEAEAKLAKAVEALRFYSTQDVCYPRTGPVSFAGFDDNGRKARATLAEIEGEKDA